MLKKTRAQIQEEITNVFITIETEHMGLSSIDVKTYVFEDVILIRLRGVLTPAEHQLAQNREGRSLVKEIRRRLFETTRPMIEEAVRQITGARLVSVHTDMSTSTGERVIVLVVDTCLD